MEWEKKVLVINFISFDCSFKQFISLFKILCAMLIHELRFHKFFCLCQTQRLLLFLPSSVVTLWHAKLAAGLLKRRQKAGKKVWREKWRESALTNIQQYYGLNL